MQSTLLSPVEASNHDSSPSATQVYQSQLGDYELLLSFMRAETGSISQFRQTVLRPRTFSPLDQENEVGHEALQQLLKNTDYLELCKTYKVSPHFLIVTLKDGTYVYETSNRGSEEKIVLPMCECAHLQALTDRIEKSAALMGGQIRYDRLVSLPGIAAFYGLTPWDPADTAANKAAIATVEDKIASYRLSLEDDFNVLDLKRHPTQKDHEVFQAVQSASSTSSQVDKQALQAQIIAREAVDTISTFLPQGSASPLTYFAQDILPSATYAQVRATPAVYLQKILQSPQAEELATTLLSVMDWYGGKTGEETSPQIRTKVVANALQIWLKSPTTEHPEGIAGFDWQSHSHWGKSYQAIWKEFETHLLTSKRAASEKEAIVIARLFLGQFPIEFRVSNIPTDLPYRSSLVWVNFLNGVNLINAGDPGALSRMTFQQLVDLPLQRSLGATSDGLNEISLARLLPALDWAQTQGIITRKRHETYVQDEIELALTELDNHSTALTEAITRLNEEPPKRLSMAKSAVEKLFGKDFFSDGRKLTRKRIETIRWNSVPTLKGKEYDYYSAVDVLASGKFDDLEPWNTTTLDGEPSQRWVRIDKNRSISSSRWWDLMVGPPTGTLPDIPAQFDRQFKLHLQSLTTSYQTLIQSLLASLAFSDRQSLEWGELRIYSLRKETQGIEAQNETAEIILPLRARNGLIVQSTFNNLTTTYELLPRAGVIRRIANPDAEQFGGDLKSEQWRLAKSTVAVSVRRHKSIPFDWDAHANANVPKQDASCQAIIEQLGEKFIAVPLEGRSENVPLSISSSRCAAISKFIATQLLFVDPEKLRSAAYGRTEFEREQALHDKALEIGKMFVPFWKSVEDVASGDRTRLINGAFGLFTDLLSFAQPIGKFTSGSIKLLSNASRLTLRARLPVFASLSKELLILTVQALNPIDGVVTLLRALGGRGLRLGRTAIFRLQELTGKAGHYDFVQSLPQMNDGGRWRPWVSGDQLATIRGIDDVPVRNIASTGKANYRLIDPLSSKPYGPSLTTHSGGLSLGRSRYHTLENSNRQVIVELADNSRVREVLEVDGRTTLFIDDQPYRLKNGTLRRAELTDDTYKAIPCRVPRTPGKQLCKTSYVVRDPAPTPDIGSFDTTKGWAPWFGDVIYTPATGRAAMRISGLRAHSTLEATMEFQKGIYGRAKVSMPVAGQPLVDTVSAGVILVEAADGSKHYVFMRLNAGDFYVAERVKGQSVYDRLTFKKADTLHAEVKKELLVVYTGSLNANNMVRIHGQASVERALKAMNEIAIPIGGHANPPETLKWLKVDTSPAEAVLFDHSTRMIVRASTDGAATWSLSKAAPDNVRETTAEIFNNLFAKKVITVESSTQSGPKALRIDDTMMQLQRLIGTAKRQRVHGPRNIAFAEIKTKSGVHEVYVSVSGSKGDTDYLPLFAKHKSTREVKVGTATYINIDQGVRFPQTALHVTPQGKLQAIPHTIDNIETYSPALTSRPTSLDTESKLVSVIRAKYPDSKDLESITIATTMAPCDSCSVVMKQFSYDGSPNALDVAWK
ncbi:deaminase domain-containing protein [Pseudomonas sp. PD9R]|uniref:deaminase domain-containing protein n=1 Tax=Pseudomonas sp. PD9R TaxID=2853534 RepID=UPI001C4594F3|nr:deaminase domain-containing protein [Pseudomonas sp. PD9R]MBV6825645.1 hypothetical protein [Pseudomonas sp. PD9R]